MKALLIFAIFLAVSSKFTEIKLKRKESFEKQLERNFFEREFAKHKSFQKFMKAHSHKTQFFSKYSKQIKKYYRKLVLKNSLYSGYGTVYFGGEYTANVQVGNPPQTISVMFDTGSSDFFVGSPDCQVCIENGVVPFNSSLSSTFNNLNITIKDVYGPTQQGVTAIEAKDTLRIGGLEAKDFDVSLVINETIVIIGQGSSGLFGLAFPALSNFKPTPAPNLLTVLKAQNQVEAAVFSFYISNPNDDNNLLILGGVDQQYYKPGTLKYYQVIQAEFYKIEFKGFKINNTEYSFDGKGILDTGTTTIVTTPEIATEINNVVGSYNCNDIPYESLFNLYIIIGDDNYVLTPQQYINPYSNVENQCGINFGEDPHFLLNTNPNPRTVLGFLFLQYYYLVFDVENLRVGLAEKI